MPDPIAGIQHKSYVIYNLYLFHERVIVILILQMTELRPEWFCGLLKITQLTDHTGINPQPSLCAV